MLTALDADPQAFGDPERSFVDTIREHGWFRTNVFAEEDEPGFSYTTGLWVTTNAPEIVLFSMKGEVAHGVFWNIFNDAKNGIIPTAGIRTIDIFSNQPAYFFVVDEKCYQEYFGWSRWFYAGDSFPCFQLVWPDREGLFPWEPGFDRAFENNQPDLTERGWAASVIS